LRGMWWRVYLTARGAKVGKNFQMHSALDLLLRDDALLSNIVIGDNVSLGGKVYIRMRKNGRLTLGDNVRIGTEVWLAAANDAEIKVGEGVALGSYSIFNGGHGIAIGPHCIFAAFIYINSSEHLYRRGELIQKQGFTGAPITIGADVWLGGNVTIGKGVTIGDGAVVGAGAVVTKSIPAYAVAVGIPARVIKYRE